MSIKWDVVYSSSTDLPSHCKGHYNHLYPQPPRMPLLQNASPTDLCEMSRLVKTLLEVSKLSNCYIAQTASQSNAVADTQHNGVTVGRHQAEDITFHLSKD